MITKAIVRRQLENGELTNIQTITFDGDNLLDMNLDSTPYEANSLDQTAYELGMTPTHKVNKIGENEIHISTWVA